MFELRGTLKNLLRRRIAASLPNAKLAKPAHPSPIDLISLGDSLRGGLLPVTIFRGVLALVLFTSSSQAGEVFSDPLRPLMQIPSLESLPSFDGQASALPRLSMIVRRADQSYAVIDGLPRRQGEQWSGWRLQAIHPSSVLLVREGEAPLELSLIPITIHKKTARIEPGKVHP